MSPPPKYGCPYLDVAESGEETRGICTVQGVLLSPIDINNLCTNSRAYQSCVAYKMGREYTEPVESKEVILEEIKQNLESNITLDIMQLAEKFRVLPSTIRNLVREYNESEEYLGVVGRNKIIPIISLTNTVREIMRSDIEISVADLAEQLEVEPDDLVEAIIYLVSKGRI